MIHMVNKGADVAGLLSARYKAQPSWVTIQVVPNSKFFRPFFVNLTTERLSVSIRERDRRL